MNDIMAVIWGFGLKIFLIWQMVYFLAIYGYINIHYNALLHVVTYVRAAVNGHSLIRLSLSPFN